MSEALKPPVSPIDSGWLARVTIRHLKSEDLPSLEWEGEFKHFRRVYHEVYGRMRKGLAMMWGAELLGVGLIGQAFVQFKNASPLKFSGRLRNGYIHSFRVRPAYRRAGVGNKLMQTIEEDLAGRGFHLVSMNVSRTNVPALRFYSHRGYHIVKPDQGKWSYHDHRGVLKHVHEPGWRMHKKLR
jgi:ribosomal protein S18 acetylase RimI-like enzyme